MKKLVVIMALAAALSGCALSYESIERSKGACLEKNGTVGVSTLVDGTVQYVTCTLDGVSYLVDPRTGLLFNGKRVSQ